MHSKNTGLVCTQRFCSCDPETVNLTNYFETCTTKLICEQHSNTSEKKLNLVIKRVWWWLFVCCCLLCVFFVLFCFVFFNINFSR